MNIKRSDFPLIYFQGEIWAIGGWSNGGYINTIEIYDICENKWNTVDTKLLLKRSSHRAIVHDKKFFVVGGENVDGILSSVELYSNDTKQFSFVTSMNFSRSDFGCCIVNSRLYAIGGILNDDDDEPTDEVEIYDIEHDVWEKGPSLPLPLAEFGCSSNLQH